jgi:hypothetical protein
MSTLSSIPSETLLAVYEGQRTESLQHRQSILNSYGFAMAGLTALGAGAVALGKIALPVKIVLTLAVLAICGFVYAFIKKQRAEAEKGLAILRKIEKHWKVLACDDANNSSLLPRDWCSPATLRWGLTKGDLSQVGSLFVLAVLILLLIWLLPLP